VRLGKLEDLEKKKEQNLTVKQNGGWHFYPHG
jgi:hypothetical protein